MSLINYNTENKKNEQINQDYWNLKVFSMN